MEMSIRSQNKIQFPNPCPLTTMSSQKHFGGGIKLLDWMEAEQINWMERIVHEAISDA